ncbi:hypothetical protein [Paenibacillus alkalitolerans]|nr:hypothetical protein [Paenibacillus alkalitolerans]
MPRRSPPIFRLEGADLLLLPVIIVVLLLAAVFVLFTLLSL